jgi:hypothetical protein
VSVSPHHDAHPVQAQLFGKLMHQRSRCFGDKQATPTGAVAHDSPTVSNAGPSHNHPKDRNGRAVNFNGPHETVVPHQH